MFSLPILKQFASVSCAYKTCMPLPRLINHFKNSGSHLFPIHSRSIDIAVSEDIERSVFSYPSWYDSEKRLSLLLSSTPTFLHQSINRVRSDLTKIGAEANYNLWERNNIRSYPTGLRRFYDQDGKITYLPIIIDVIVADGDRNNDKDESKNKDEDKNKNIWNHLYVANVPKGIYISITNTVNIFTFEDTKENMERERKMNDEMNEMNEYGGSKIIEAF